MTYVVRMRWAINYGMGYLVFITNRYYFTTLYSCAQNLKKKVFYIERHDNHMVRFRHSTNCVETLYMQK